MPVLGELAKARGRAAVKIAEATKSITGTGSFSAAEFGLTRIIAPLSAVVLDAPSTVPSESVSITSATETSVSVVVVSHTTTAGAEHAVSTAARSVRVVVIGE